MLAKFTSTYFRIIWDMFPLNSVISALSWQPCVGDGRMAGCVMYCHKYMGGGREGGGGGGGGGGEKVHELERYHLMVSQILQCNQKRQKSQHLNFNATVLKRNISGGNE